MFNLSFSSSHATSSCPGTDPSVSAVTSSVTKNGRRSRRRPRNRNKQKVEPMTKESVASGSTDKSHKHHDAPMTKSDLYFALDCEMVGTGPDGFDSAVARVTVINWEKDIVLDTFVKVPVPVTDYRTHVSGVRAQDLESEDAMTFEEARTAVEKILRGKILIGHGLENDLCSLGLTHPWCDVRDTAIYAPYMREAVDYEGGKVLLRPRKLRDLAWEKLGLQIQDDGKPHCPIEDAGAALDLYKEKRAEWEEELRRQQQQTYGQEQHTTNPELAPGLDPGSSPHTPYQVPFDPTLFSGPYGSKIPGFSPAPDPYAGVTSPSIVCPDAPQQQQSTSSWWFTRSKSPNNDHPQGIIKEYQVYQPSATASFATSSRPSSSLFSFRRSASSKRNMLQQSMSIETTTTVDSEGESNNLETGRNALSSEWDRTTTSLGEQLYGTSSWSARNTEENEVWKEAPPRRSRLATYLSLKDKEDTFEVLSDGLPNNAEEWLQPPYYEGQDWTTEYHSTTMFNNMRAHKLLESQGLSDVKY